MTMPVEPAPLDVGNTLLAETGAQLTTALVPTAQGQRLAFTIRTPSTTLTVFLVKDDAIAWAGNVRNMAKQMSSSGLIVATPGVNGAVGQQPS